MKILRRIMMALLLISAIFISFAPRAYAVDYVPIPKSGGGNITYRGSGGVEVKMPSEYIAKDAEFRAVWVTNVTGDIPSFVTETQYKSAMTNVFDTMEYYNMNAIIFHVRTHHDALYNSKLNKISSHYAHVDFNEFDPLEWLIEESHRRGIEFHAWMNPYRIGSASSLEEMASRYPAGNPASKTENLLRGRENIILDPGSPEVRSFIIDTVMELIENYDVDAIHFDDYFYEANVDDSATRAKYNTGNLSISNFRRLQVDTFIKDLYEEMTTYNISNNRYVQLGISPSGIYRNGSYVPLSNYQYDSNGKLTYPLFSSSAGFAHYDDYLYSDTKKWIDNEWIDYIVPQVYWSFDHPSAPYADVVDWWSGALKNSNVNLYIGMGLYTAGNSSSFAWYNDSNEAINEIKFASKHEPVNGHVIFSYQHIEQAARQSSGILFQNMDKVKKQAWTKDVILPEIKTMSPVNLGKVSNFKLSKTSAGYRLDFDDITQARSYAIYRSKDPLNFTNAELIKVVGKTAVDGVISYIDQVNTNTNYYYGVRVISRTNTVGDGVSLATTSASTGGLIPIGKLPNITLPDIAYKNEDIELKWEKVLPNFGTEALYEIYKSTDGENYDRVSVTPKISGFNVSVKVPLGDANKYYLYMKAKNNVSEQNTKVYEINTYEKLGDVNNLVILGDYYTNRTVDIKWNTVFAHNNLEYEVYSSSDQKNWKLLNDSQSEIIIDNGIAKFSYKLPSTSGTLYFRVLAKSETGRSFSKTLKYQVFDKLPDFKIKVNSKAYTGPVYVGDGLVVNITWDNISRDATYRVTASHDMKNWRLARLYNNNNTLVVGETTSTQKIQTDIIYYVLFVQVEATTETGIILSEIIEIRVMPGMQFFQFFMSNYYYQHNTILNKTNIFK